MMDDTRDIRITRLEGRVETLENVQGVILDKLDVLIANQSKLIALVQELAVDVAVIKDRVIGRPMGFVLPEDDDG